LVIHYTKEFGRKIPVSEKIFCSAGPTLGKFSSVRSMSNPPSSFSFEGPGDGARTKE
jgi:hypothetical protein